MVPRIGMPHSTTLDTECGCQIQDLHKLNKFDYMFRVCVYTSASCQIHVITQGGQILCNSTNSFDRTLLDRTYLTNNYYSKKEANKH